MVSGLKLRAIYRLNNLHPDMGFFADNLTKCQLHNSSIHKIPYPTAPNFFDAVTCDDYELNTTTNAAAPKENILLFVGNSCSITKNVFLVRMVVRMWNSESGFRVC